MEHAGKKIDDEELAAAMKGKGLGTPATRAETIEKLITRIYWERKGGSLRATAHGIKMIDILRRIPIEWITSAELTGDMEAKLDGVQRGTNRRDAYMSEIRNASKNLLTKLETTTALNFIPRMNQ